MLRNASRWSNCPLPCCLASPNALLAAVLSADLNPVLDHDEIAGDSRLPTVEQAEPFTTRCDGPRPDIAKAASRYFTRKAGAGRDLLRLTQ